MIDQGVTAALAARDALRSTNGDDSHNSRTGVRRTERATRECTYIKFLKCQPLPFKGTEGVSSTVGHEAACGMTWKTLMKMMIEKYCPRNEIKKLEMELWDLKEEEEEHPAPANSIVVAPTAADQAPSAEETEPFETDESAATPPPHPAYRMTARISIPAPVPMPAWTDSEIPFPPLPPILSPPSPILSPAPPPSPIRSLGYRAAMIRLRDEAASTSSPPLQLPSASRREDRPEVTLPLWKRLDIAISPRYEVGESSSAAAARPTGGLRADYGFVATVDREIVRDPKREVGYGITDSWDEIVETLQGAQVSTDTELGGYTEARMSREAWVRATDASDLVHG
nr:hypothetical protein [Tanacetum cinerariifolium]